MVNSGGGKARRTGQIGDKSRPTAKPLGGEEQKRKNVQRKRENAPWNHTLTEGKKT